MLYKRIVYNYNLDVIDINHRREHRDKEKGAKSNELDNGFSKLIQLIHTENKEKLIRDMDLEIMKPVALTKVTPKKTYRPRSPTTTNKSKLPPRVSFKSRFSQPSFKKTKRNTKRKILGNLNPESEYSNSWTRFRMSKLTKKNKSKLEN